MTKQHESSKIHDVLGRLLKAQNITVTRLARLTGVGQPVIFRIMSGEIQAPKVSTARAIAKYFGISIDQLAGYAPLPKNLSQLQDMGWRSIPLYTLKEVVDSQLKKANTKTIYTEMGKNDQCFAIAIEGSAMEPRFYQDNTIIIDPTLTPKEGDFILAYIPGEKQAQLKQLKLDGSTKYLKPLNAGFATIQPKKMDVLGVAVEAKIDLT